MIQRSGDQAPSTGGLRLATWFLAALVILVSVPFFAATPRRAVAPSSQSGSSSNIQKFPSCVPAMFQSQPTATPQWIPLYGSSILSAHAIGTFPAVAWYTWGTDVFVGLGETLAVSPSTHTCYYAVAINGCGRQKSLGAWVMISTPILTQNPTVTPSMITAGQTATLEAGGGTGQGTLTYKWFTGDGTLVGTGKKLVVQPSVTTSYYYKLCNDLESDPSIQVTVTVK